MYAEYDRILLSNDDIVLNKLRHNSTPPVIPISASDVYVMDSLVVQNPDNCGARFSNTWLQQKLTDVSCIVPLFFINDTDMLWLSGTKDSFISIRKAILRIQPHKEMGNVLEAMLCLHAWVYTCVIEHMCIIH